MVIMLTRPIVIILQYIQLSNQYYTSSNEPDNSFGNDGDIYFVKGE